MKFISFLLFLMLIVIMYAIVIKVFTVLLRMTGVTADKSRTQIISMLTNCGFTTEESELVLSSRKRRRLAQTVMLCGHAFSVLVVSILVNLFLSLNQAELRDLVLPTTVLFCVTALMLITMYLRPVRTWFDRQIEKISNRFIYGQDTNALILVDIYRARATVEVLMDYVPEQLADISLAESRLREDYDIQLLLVTRNNEPLDKLNGKTVLMAGDVLVLFGNYKNIRAVFAHSGNLG